MKKISVVVICALAVVAYLSSMSYEQQTIIPFLREYLVNEPLKGFLSRFEFTYWGKTISVEASGYDYFVEFLIRKGTHFTGYGLLAVLLFIFYRKLNGRFPASFAFISIVIIASLDEIRQAFSPGRTGLIEDVKIDAIGAIVFLFLAKIMLSIINKVKKAESHV